jgi:hypothetical protein
MGQLGFGIVGTGMIAGVIADAIAESTNGKLIAVSGRQPDSARSFVATRQGVAAVQGLDALLTRKDVNAVYIGTPTAPKEEVALAAIAAGKHVPIEKPFVSFASVLRMTKAVAAKGVIFMDATHFVHHPRTAAIRAESAEKIGSPRSLHTTFYFPFSDRTNIRYNVKLEPMGALGDMAWYSMRGWSSISAPKGESRRSLMLLNATPKPPLWCDLRADWTDSFAFKNPDIKTGYSYRTGMATRKDVTFVPTPSLTSGEVAMIETFAGVVASGNGARGAELAQSALKRRSIWTRSGLRRVPELAFGPSSIEHRNGH